MADRGSDQQKSGRILTDERWATEELTGTGPREDLARPVMTSSAPAPEYRDIRRRFSDLQIHSKRAAGLVTTLSIISALVVLLLLLTGGVLLAGAFARGDIDLDPLQSTGMILVDILFVFQFVMFTGFVIWMLVMSILTLLKAYGLFARQQSVAMAELMGSSIGLVVADDGLWQRITDRFRRGWRGTMSTKHHYAGIETHIFLCACHWESLQRISRGDKEPVWYRFNQDQQSFQTLKFFYRPKTWQIVLSCLAAIVLIIHLILITLITCTFYGMRYITVYARMNALSEFFLGEYTVED